MPWTQQLASGSLKSALRNTCDDSRTGRVTPPTRLHTTNSSSLPPATQAALVPTQITACTPTAVLAPAPASVPEPAPAHMHMHMPASVSTAASTPATMTATTTAAAAETPAAKPARQVLRLDVGLASIPGAMPPRLIQQEQLKQQLQQQQQQQQPPQKRKPLDMSKRFVKPSVAAAASPRKGGYLHPVYVNAAPLPAHAQAQLCAPQRPVSASVERSIAATFSAHLPARQPLKGTSLTAYALPTRSARTATSIQAHRLASAQNEAAANVMRPNTLHDMPLHPFRHARSSGGTGIPSAYTPHSIKASMSFPRPMSASGAIMGPFETLAFRGRAINHEV